MRVDDAPEDDEVRQTYNFAPGSHGLVYRADVPDYGAGNRHHRHDRTTEDTAGEDNEISGQIKDSKETQYKLQSMKWGAWLLPHASDQYEGLKVFPHRFGSFLDEAQPRLWFGYEDHQC